MAELIYRAAFAIATHWLQSIPSLSGKVRESADGAAQPNNAMNKALVICLALLTAATLIPASAAPLSLSYYPVRPDDPQATYVQAPALSADATGSLQSAIDQEQAAHTTGIVFVPPGRYRITRTINLWPGIRLIGYGATRPVLILAKNTPGFQERGSGADGSGEGKSLIHFTGDRPKNPGDPVPDANPGTFYSAVSNIDIVIQDGNPAAVGVRFHAAQHCYLAHMSFQIGSGLAGVEEVGNEAEDLHFTGGEYGIMAHKTSPSWPFVLLDSAFSGQRKAGILSSETGLTLIRDQFANVPTAIETRPIRAEELWMEDSRLENIPGPAVIISNGGNARTEISLQNIACRSVLTFVQFRERGNVIRGLGTAYRVEEFSHGLRITDSANPDNPVLSTLYAPLPVPSLPAPPPTDIPSLPAARTWINAHSVGVIGDGQADDTAALQAAIDKYPAIYLPSGRYKITSTLTLRPDTALIGLSPISTQLDLPDFTPAFAGVGAPMPMIEAPRGGTDIVTGIGLDAGANPRAVACLWKAGANSMVSDVRFLGGHGTNRPDGTREDPYNSAHTGDPDANRKWDANYPSLWITDGGGGTFKNIWTPDTLAQAGLMITDTDTPGRIYALSSEHHVRHEIEMSNVANWKIRALQTEEEWGESPNALPLLLQNCHDISFANSFLFRVYASAIPFPYAVKVQDSTSIYFYNVHIYGQSKYNFDNALYITRTNLQIRPREIAALLITGRPSADQPAHVSPVLAPGASLRALASGFNGVDSLTVAPDGSPYWIDGRWNSIYSWSPGKGLILVQDAALNPSMLAFDKAGNAIAVGKTGLVYTFDPSVLDAPIHAIAPSPGGPRPGLTAMLPVSRWRDSYDFNQANLASLPNHYLSPDGTAFIPAPADYPNTPYPRPWWIPTLDLARTFALAPADPRKPFYVADEYDQKTWKYTVDPDGTLSNPQSFAEQGEVGSAVDTHGNVYIAAGEVYVYNPTGQLIDTISVPTRPTGIAFGGADGKTLFIAGRTAVYSVDTR